jgi:hypothetical protein
MPRRASSAATLPAMVSITSVRNIGFASRGLPIGRLESRLPNSFGQIHGACSCGPGSTRLFPVSFCNRLTGPRGVPVSR